jgi:hypothetical protein
LMAFRVLCKKLLISAVHAQHNFALKPFRRARKRRL